MGVDGGLESEYGNGMEVTIKETEHPLLGTPRYSLWRVKDGKLEASGYHSLEEITDYVETFGLVVVDNG